MGVPLTWRLFDDVVHGDVAMEWSPGGIAYAAMLRNLNSNTINVSSSANPVGGVRLADIGGSSNYNGNAANGGVDQPWMKVARIGGQDRIYVAFNDFTRPRNRPPSGFPSRK